MLVSVNFNVTYAVIVAAEYITSEVFGIDQINFI